MIQALELEDQDSSGLRVDVGAVALVVGEETRGSSFESGCPGTLGDRIIKVEVDGVEGGVGLVVFAFCEGTVVVGWAWMLDDGVSLSLVLFFKT